MTCATTGAALRNGLALTSLRDAATGSPLPMRTIIGIAPDRAGYVLAHSPKATCSIPVYAGLFLAHDHVAEPPDTFTVVSRRSTTPHAAC